MNNSLSFSDYCKISNIRESIDNLFLNPINKNISLNDILDKFKQSGGEILGQGTYATVLYRPEWNYVIKIFFNDSPYVNFVRFAYKNPRQSFPKFYDIPRKIVPQFKRTTSNEFMYFVKQEKLEKITKEEFMDLEFYLYYGNPNDISEELLKNSHIWRETKKKLENILEKHPNIDQFRDDYNFLRRSLKMGSEDFHQNNFMKRKDGTFVAIDPVHNAPTIYQMQDAAVKAEIGDYEYEDGQEPKMLIGGERNKKTKKKHVVIKKRREIDDEIPF